ncbi:MAG: T9SS type A sorting domain-containing protein [Ignavibacterium sp.]
MKLVKTTIHYTALIAFALSVQINAQLNFVVNSLADDENSYAYDDPNTPQDESSDGVCADALGRCTIRAAIDEAFIMNQSINLTFGVSGTINLLSYLFLPYGSSMSGNNQITLTNPAFILGIENDCTIQGMKLSDAMVAIEVQGSNNKIGIPTGDYNEFVDCQTAIGLQGDNNLVSNNLFGITLSGSLQPCGTGIIISGNYNSIGKNEINASNIFCGSTIAGIIIGTGEGNIVEGNYIGTNIDQQTGLGNAIGVMISSDNNLIGGSGIFSTNVISGNQIAIGLQAAPPDTYADNNLIVNNIIGLSKFENAVIPNNNGIMITNGVTNARIYDNIIAGNTAVGIGIFGYDTDSYTTGHRIYRNRIGVNKNDVQYPNEIGISILGNVADVSVGVNEINEYHKNIIVGNTDTGLELESLQGFSPNGIVFRKNIIHSNGVVNLFMDSQVNLGLSAPTGLTFNGNTLSGSHPLPGMTIDIYRANRFELPASAYEWLGSTTTNANGTFSFLISDPSVQAVSVTATNPLSGSTSAIVKYSLVTDVEDEEQIPTEFSLNQNYPNPFNPSTKIKFSIPNVGSELAQTVLKVYDILGNEVATLVNEERPAGVYEVEFNASQLSSGIYFYKLSSGSFTEIKKMTLIK